MKDSGDEVMLWCFETSLKINELLFWAVELRVGEEEADSLLCAGFALFKFIDYEYYATKPEMKVT